MSIYDQIHDEYLNGGGNKTGTKYERLMALVVAALNRGSVVVHDVKLRGGDTGVKHQIDVRLVRPAGEQRHLLIECKDFDESGDPVGLPIVRNFFGAVDDVKPDEAWIVTCHGFTRDAIRYARGKRIKLAVLREFRESDRENRIETVEVTVSINKPENFKSNIRFRTEDAQRLAEVRGLGEMRTDYFSPVHVILADGSREQFNLYLERKMNAGPAVTRADGRFEVDAMEPGIRIQYGDAEPIAPETVTVDYELRALEPIKIRVSIADKIARLLLHPIDDETDYIILDDHLREFRIDEETGEVIPCGGRR